MSFQYRLFITSGNIMTTACIALWAQYGKIPNIWVLLKISKCLKIHIFVGIYHYNQSVFIDGDGIKPKKICTVIPNNWKMAKNCSNNIFADKAINRESTFNRNGRQVYCNILTRGKYMYMEFKNASISNLKFLLCKKQSYDLRILYLFNTWFLLLLF